MAKKRKKEKKEEDYEYKEPEFDEEEYLRKEVRDSRALFATLGYAVLIGIVSFGLTFVDVALAALVGFIAMVFLRHIYPRVGVDTTLLEKKNWAGNIIMYLFTWLAVWILLVNPPFSDFAEPTIENVGIYFQDDSGNWTKKNDTTDLKDLWNVSINATIVDNVDVDKNTIIITIEREIGDEYTEIYSGPMERIGENRYSYILVDVDAGKHKYTIKASDINNNEASFSGTFEVF